MGNCPNCGANVDSDDIFCKVCGTKVSMQSNNFLDGPQQTNNSLNTNNTSNSVNSSAAKPKTSKNAICSLVFAVVSLFIFWWLSLAAISTGIVALREIKVKNEKGKGLAIAGIVIGVICELLYWYGEIMTS